MAAVTRHWNCKFTCMLLSITILSQACEDVKAGLTEKDEDMNAKQHTVTTEKRLQLEPLGEEVVNT